MAERSADLMVSNLLADDETKAALQAAPEATLKRAAVEAKRQLPRDGDIVVYRMVVGFLGSTVLLVALGTIALTWNNVTNLPDVLTALGSAAVGALAGLLAPTPNSG